MNCDHVQRLFPSYLDGTVNGVEMQAVAAHLEHCEPCGRGFAQMRGLQGVLAAVGPVRMPTDLGLRLRVAISHESARRQSRWWDTASVRWENIVRPVMLRVSAGFAIAVLLLGTIGLMAGAVATPTTVLANDEPLGALTAPHYLYSTVPAQPLAVTDDAPILVQADIDERGEVYDFTVLAGPQDERTLTQLRDRLMVDRYAPARAFDQPVRGRILVTFAGTNVRG